MRLIVLLTITGTIFSSVICLSRAFVVLSEHKQSQYYAKSTTWTAAQSSSSDGGGGEGGAADACSTDYSTEMSSPETQETFTQSTTFDNDDDGEKTTSVEAVFVEDESPEKLVTIDAARRDTERSKQPDVFSRREWWNVATATFATTVATGIVSYHYYHDVPPIAKGERIAPVNLTQVVKESKIKIAIQRGTSSISLDPITLQKKKVIELPAWIPERWVPRTKVIKDTTDQEILIAAAIAGSIVEMTRTSILWPLITLKTRVQTDINVRQRKVNKRLRIKRRLRVLELNIVRHFKEGDLYAGLLPTLLVTAPATGLYYGIRDISKRSFAALPVPELYVAVGAAFLGSVVSIAFRSPVDALSARLQVATAEENNEHPHVEHGDAEDEQLEQEVREERVRERVGNWFLESMERLPALVVTEIPYLLSRIVLNGLFIQGTLDLGHYELIAISTAIICGILTTPFDVARTRILLDSDNDPTNGIDGGSGEGLMKTFQTIVGESNDGYANLFRGWFERALYLGIGRAWLEPLQLLGYVALRDAILLEWFD